LAISDVPGDDPSQIASGPTVGDPTTVAEARSVLRRFGIAVPDPVEEHWRREEAETPKPRDPRLGGESFEIVASASTALSAAERRARREGLLVKILGDSLQGEAWVVGKEQACLAREVRREGTSSAPWVLLSGGETTVTVRGKGRGGRNTELLLALALELEGCPGVWALAADTDGIDGDGPHAGAVVTPTTLTRARDRGLDPQRALAENDSGSFFEALGDVVKTGPTRTNVNDFRAVLVEPGRGL
jgi:hydroxypyruvate reductase